MWDLNMQKRLTHRQTYTSTHSPAISLLLLRPNAEKCQRSLQQIWPFITLKLNQIYTNYMPLIRNAHLAPFAEHSWQTQTVSYLISWLRVSRRSGCQALLL